MQERADILGDLVYQASILTHTNPLGITPAFALAYAIFRMLGSPHGEEVQDPMPFHKDGFVEQLNQIYMETCHFEKRLKQHGFGSGGDINVFSGMLDQIINHVKKFRKKNSRAEVLLQSIVDSCILPIAKQNTTTNIYTPNHCFSLASVTHSLVAGLLLKDTRFLGSLQYMYMSGGDTDTVGAMFGGLVGAYIGHTVPWTKRIKPYYVNQFIEPDAIKATFNAFIKVVLDDAEPPKAGSPRYVPLVHFVALEERVNKALSREDDNKRINAMIPTDRNDVAWFHLKKFSSLRASLSSFLAEKSLEELFDRQSIVEAYCSFHTDVVTKDDKKIKHLLLSLEGSQRQQLFERIYTKTIWDKITETLK